MVSAGMGAVERATREQLRAVRGREVAPALYANVVKVARTLDSTTAARDTAALSAQHAQRMREILEAVRVAGRTQQLDPVEQVTASREARLSVVQ